MNNPLKYIDPTGTDTTHVNTDGKIQAILPGGDDIVVVDEPLSEVTVETKAVQKPGNGTVATGYIILNVNTSAGVSVGANVVIIVNIEKGPDAGKTIRLSEANLSGGAILDVSGNLGIIKYEYIGDIGDLRTSTFEGNSTFENTSMGTGLVLGFGNAVSEKDRYGGVLKSRIFTIGVGAGLPFNVSGGKTISKPHKR